MTPHMGRKLKCSGCRGMEGQGQHSVVCGGLVVDPGPGSWDCGFQPWERWGSIWGLILIS